jgi:trans-2,3-dihydro-3-hydroxyanthranilate isomerase
MRIFTPGSELPMAGHPTIGTTFALADEGVIARGRRDFVFECGVGLIPVELEWYGDVLSFVWMTQPLPSFGPELVTRGDLASAIGLEAHELVDLPLEIVSCGVPYLMIPLATRAAVDKVIIDQRALTAVFQRSRIASHALFVFTTDRTGATGDETVYSRMLAPDIGIAEDPATGSAAGPLGCYLLHHGVVTAEQAISMLSLQGVKMKRPSRLYISVESRDEVISRVRVGGKSVLVAEGSIVVGGGSGSRFWGSGGLEF